MHLFPKKSKENPNILGRNRAHGILKATNTAVGVTLIQDSHEGSSPVYAYSISEVINS